MKWTAWTNVKYLPAEVDVTSREELMDKIQKIADARPVLLRIEGFTDQVNVYRHEPSRWRHVATYMP